MEELYSYADYRSYISDYIQTQAPGVKKKIAAAIRISPSLLSQILKGERVLNSEQAFRFASFIGLSSFEKTYWLTTVENNNATSSELKKFLEERLNELRKEASFTSRKRLGLKHTTWSQEFVAVFYSSWHFVAIYCVLAVDQLWTAPLLANRFNLPEDRVGEVLRFFTEHEIVERDEKQNYRLKKTGYVYVDGKDTHPHLAAVLHNCKNFRQKAMAEFEATQFNKSRETTFHTVTALVSESDFQALRKDVQKLLERLNEKIAKGNFEKVICLNIDYFKL